jgi:hypothetical protein
MESAAELIAALIFCGKFQFVNCLRREGFLCEVKKPTERNS